MKKILLTAVIALGTISLASARAKIPVCFPCESLQTVQELPEDSELNTSPAEKLHIGYLNDEYGLLWMALWNSEGRFVLSDESNTTYYDIDPETEAYLKESHGFDIKTADNPLSFWKKMGGKLVFIVVILGLGYSANLKRSRGKSGAS